MAFQLIPLRFCLRDQKTVSASSSSLNKRSSSGSKSSGSLKAKKQPEKSYPLPNQSYNAFCSLESKPKTLVVVENGLKGSLIESYFKKDESIHEYRDSLLKSSHVFSADQVFSPSVSNAEIYSETIKRHLSHAISGKNVAFLVAGGRRSGKKGLVFSVDPKDRGVLQRFIASLSELMTKEKKPKKEIIVAGVHNEKVYDLLKNKEVNLRLEEESRQKNGAAAKGPGLFRLEIVDSQKDLGAALAALKNSMKLLEHSTKDKNFKKGCVVVININLEWVDEGNQRETCISFVLLNTDECQKGAGSGTIEILKKYLVHCAISEKIDQASQIHRESLLTTLLRPSLHEESSFTLIGALSSTNYASTLRTIGFLSDIQQRVATGPKKQSKESLRSRSRERIAEKETLRPEEEEPISKEIVQEEQKLREMNIARDMENQSRAREEERERKEIIEALHYEKTLRKEMEIQRSSNQRRSRAERDERSEKNLSLSQTIADLETQIDKLYEQTVSISPALGAEEKRALLLNLDYKATRLGNFVKKLGYDEPGASRDNQDFLKKLEKSKELISGLQKENKGASTEARRSGRSRNRERLSSNGKNLSAQIQTLEPEIMVDAERGTPLPPKGTAGKGQGNRISSPGRASNGSLTPVSSKPVQILLPGDAQIDLKKNLSDHLSKIAFLEESIKIKDNLIRSLESQLDRTKHEAAVVQSELHILREKELNFVKNEETYKNVIHELEEELAKGNSKKGKMEERIAKIQEELSTELEVMAQAKKESDLKAEGAFRDLDEEVRKGRELEDLLKKERVDNAKLNEAINSTEKKAKESIDELLYQLEFMTQKNNEMQMEKESLKSRLETAEDQLRIAVAKRNKTKNKSQAEFTRAIEEQTEVAQKKSKRCKELKKIVKELETQIKEEKDDYNKMKVENEKALIIKANYTGDVEKLKHELGETKRELEFKTKDHEKMKDEISETKRDMKDLLEREQKLLSEIKEYERGIKMYESKFLEAQSEIQSDIQLVKKLQEENKRFGEDLGAEKAKNHHLEQEIKSLSDIQSKNPPSILWEQEIDKLERKVEDFFREIAGVREENSRLKSKEAEQNRESMKTQAELEELKTRRQDDESTIKMLRHQIKEIESRTKPALQEPVQRIVKTSPQSKTLQNKLKVLDDIQSMIQSEKNTLSFRTKKH